MRSAYFLNTFYQLSRFNKSILAFSLKIKSPANLIVCSGDHPESVLSSMQTIMIVLLEESEDVGEELLVVILSALGRNKNVSILYIYQLMKMIVLLFHSGVRYNSIVFKCLFLL